MIAVIINPVSGGASRDAAAARAELASVLLAKAGTPGKVFVTERRGHARELAAAARARGDRLVIAWGGDGTVNEVASALAFGETPLGIVPAGSGNGLARELGVDRNPDTALAALFGRGSTRLIDAGEINGRLFFNVAGVGFDAHVAACFDRELAGRRGMARYVRIALRELVGYRCATYAIRVGDDHVDGPALLVTLANSPQFGNGARIAPSARLDDGFLDLVVVREASRLETLRLVPRLFTGTLDSVPGVVQRKVARVTIGGCQPLRFHVDGEPVDGGSVLEARVHPAALSVRL